MEQARPSWLQASDPQLSDQARLTPKERELERQRCGICGLIHPFLEVCPFVEEREVRYEYALDNAGRRRARFRIERTKYFPRPQLFKALEELTEGGPKPRRKARK